ncbi:MAG: putative toxin-antitoxin system toxin component, PIN family [Burkholderiaceae bacterium]
MSEVPPSGVDSRVLVLDTNIVLDLYVYEDTGTAPLREALADSQTDWLATAPMREELARVLNYPQIGKRLVSRGLSGEAVLTLFDARACLVVAAPKAAYTCKDPDDQKFVDLAVAHRATLLSKDAEVLCMARRLARLGVTVARGM